MALNRAGKGARLITNATRVLSSQPAGDHKDLVVLGAGPGGYVAAIKAAQLGMDVACIDKRGPPGGTCLNVGCIPSKALLHSSHLYEEATKKMHKHGVNAEKVSIDLQQMHKQKDGAVSGLTKGIEGLFKKNKVEYIKGAGTVGTGQEGSRSVDIETNEGSKRTVTAKNVIVATGSEPAGLPGVTVDEKRIVTSNTAISLQEVPEHMVVIGGGVIGLELGSVWGRLGAKVTVVEATGSIVPSMDGEMRKMFHNCLKKQGFNFNLNTKVTSVEYDGNGKGLTVSTETADGNKEAIQADYALVATGRSPHTNNIGLEGVGVQAENGKVPVDDRFETKAKGVHAIGDCIHGPMLAHKAEDDGMALAEMLAGMRAHVDYGSVPNIIYTHPEVAGVGMTEEEAKEKGADYKKGVFPFQANSRARTIDDAEGAAKVIVDKKTDVVLGAHVVSPSAGDLIAECTMAVRKKDTVEAISHTCHGHPTFSESIKEAALAAKSAPIHF